MELLVDGTLHAPTLEKSWNLTFLSICYNYIEQAECIIYNLVIDDE